MDYGGNTINVVMLDNAMGVPGSVWHNADDSYTIFIDASLSVERQRQVFAHELRHILKGDFEKYCATEIESEAHKEREGCLL